MTSIIPGNTQTPASSPATLPKVDKRLEAMRNTLLGEGGAQGLSFDEMKQGGLSDFQARTRLAGFTGAFGEGRADAFRTANPEAYLKALRETTDVPIDTYVASQVKNPELASGTAFKPTMQSVQSNELMTAPKFEGATPTISTTAIPAAQSIQQSLAAAGITDIEKVMEALGTVPQVQAALVGDAEQSVAAQGSVQTNATVAGQLEKLLGGDNPQVQQIFDSAISKVSEEMGARGLGASTLASSAIIQAVSQQALPIAAQDAKTYFQMDLTNLSNENQTRLENTKLRQQAILTDVSIENATSQFNATSEGQRQQFIASTITQIQEQNAIRTTTVSQFNAAQKNSIEAQNVQNTVAVNKANTEMKLAVDKFNSELKSQRQKWEAEAAFVVEQSNTLWRRSINTQNTAAQNAAMQANVQNKFNMSQAAQNNLWQQFRDESYWMFQGSESQAGRDFNATQAANNRSLYSDDSGPDWISAAGSFASNFFQ